MSNGHRQTEYHVCRESHGVPVSFITSHYYSFAPQTIFSTSSKVALKKRCSLLSERICSISPSVRAKKPCILQAFVRSRKLRSIFVRVL